MVRNTDPFYEANIVFLYVEFAGLGYLLMHISDKTNMTRLEQQILQPTTILKLLYPNNMASCAIAVHIVNTYRVFWAGESCGEL